MQRSHSVEHDGPAEGSRISAPVQRNKSVMENVATMICPPLSRNAGNLRIPDVDFAEMKSEYKRLQTFSEAPAWTVSFISARELARAGFFCLHREDKVMCAFCKNIVGDWENGDVPMKEHKRHYPRCPFVCNLPVGNIPIGENGIPSDNISKPSLGIEKYSGPVHSSMVTITSRLKTFKDMKWPEATGQTPQNMAEAGFFYVGTQDNVKCFYCGGGLQNWAKRDNPFAVHKKFFPTCTYVILNSFGDDRKVPTCGKNKPVPSSSSLPSSSNSSSSSLSSSPSSSGSSPISSSPERPSSSSAEPTTGTVTKASNLKEELKRLKEARQCKLCKKLDASVVFLPCRHLCTCPDCSKTTNTCAVCQQPVKGLVRTYS